MRDSDSHKNCSYGAIFMAVIVAIEQCNELKKALGQSESHTQRRKAVSLDHAEKRWFENN